MQIFISHSRLDNDLAQIIVGALEKFQVDYWVDFDRLEEGDHLIRKINNGLKTSTHFMLIWTKNAEKSFWVETEIAAALELGDTINKVPLKQIVRHY